MSGGRERVRILYRRPPDRLQLFDQEIVAELENGCVVTYLAAARIGAPLEVEGETILEPEAPAVWFTYPGAWHDIGRFHLRDGTFTGYYANVLTPVHMRPGEWETTDLFLDLWMPAAGEPRLLDVHELHAAERAGTIAAGTADRARAEGERLLAAARAGAWPPEEVRVWTLERVRGAG